MSREMRKRGKIIKEELGEGCGNEGKGNRGN